MSRHVGVTRIEDKKNLNGGGRGGNRGERKLLPGLHIRKLSYFLEWAFLSQAEILVLKNRY